MGAFDESIIFFLNQFAQRWAAFDAIVVFLSNSDLIKGGVMLAGVWGAWFFASADIKRNRSYLLSALLGAVIALVIARVLAHTLPLRIRPILDPALHFRPPKGTPDQSNWTIWSSFPSDHAALFFALLTGIWMAWRRAGLVLLGYVIIVICLPRIYIGIHYPSDVLAGAALGIGLALACSLRFFRDLWTRPVLEWVDRSPAVSYAVLFIITFQIATLFWDIRTFLYIWDISV
jgi:undecaprenyl-diphosphatase